MMKFILVKGHNDIVAEVYYEVNREGWILE